MIEYDKIPTQGFVRTCCMFPDRGSLYLSVHVFFICSQFSFKMNMDLFYTKRHKIEAANAQSILQHTDYLIKKLTSQSVKHNPIITKYTLSPYTVQICGSQIHSKTIKSCNRHPFIRF